jgi:hypothetical protein
MDQTEKARPGDRAVVMVKERVTVRKFDGDPPVEGKDKPPVETIVIEDGQIIEHTILPQGEENSHAT